MTAPLDHLSVEDLLEIAERILGRVEVRDLGLLASAAARPRQSVLGEDAYRSFESKVAALLHAIARNHALVDGNKRLAWSAARVFCLLNGRDLVMPVDEAESLVVDAATGVRDVGEIAETIRRRLYTG